jgi:hypothetical protein
MKRHIFSNLRMLFVSAIASLLFFTGCATNPRGQVYRDWATSFSELGIYPIFPAREDVVVGDIYLMPMHPLNTYMIGQLGGLGMTGIHIGYADWNNETNKEGEKVLADDLEKYYRDRPTFPDGPAGAAILGATNSSSTLQKQSQNQDGAGPQSVTTKPNPDTNSPSAAQPSKASSSSGITSSNGAQLSTNAPANGSGSLNIAETSVTNTASSQASVNTISGTNAPFLETGSHGSATNEDIPKLAKAPEDTRTNIFAPLEPVRLREVAFPEFAFTTISEASAAASVPIEGVLVNAGVDSSKVSQITVKIPLAESYGLPIGKLLEKFFLKDVWKCQGHWYLRADPTLDGANVLSRPAGELARDMFTRSLQTTIHDNYPAWKHFITYHRLESRVAADTNSLYLALISEVFYTRSIDLSISLTSAFAGGASAGPIGADQVQKWMSLSSKNSTTPTTNTMVAATNATSGASSNVTSTVQTITTTSGAAENSDPFVVAEKLRNLSLGYTNGIGGSVRVLGVSGHTVALQRTFEHPIAVGARGVVMRISAAAEPLNGDITPFYGSAGTNKPTEGYRIDLYQNKPD